MNERKSGVVLSYALSAAQIVVNLLYVPLLLNTIGQKEYGLFQMIGSIIAYMNIVNGTLSAGATRYYSKFYVLGDKQGMVNTIAVLKRIYRWLNVIIMGVTAVAAVAIRCVYVGVFSPQEMTESILILIVLALNLMVTMNNTISISVIMSYQKFVFLKGTTLVTTLAQPLLVLLGIHFFPYALTVSLMQFLANTITRTWQHWYAIHRLGMTSHGAVYDSKLQKGILGFSIAIIVGSIADQLFWRTDQLILGYMYGTAVVAVYSVGSQIVNVYQPLGTAVSSVFLPRVSEIWHKHHDLKALSDLFIKVSRISLYPLLLVLTGFAVFGQSFIRLWAGPQYGLAYWVAIIELAPFTIDIMQTIGLTILQVMNKYAFRAYVFLAAAIINVILTVVLAQPYGVLGAASASGITLLICSGFVVNWYYEKKIHLDMGRFWKSIVREVAPMTLVCAVGIVVWRLQPHQASWGWLILGIIIYSIIFCASCYLVSMNQYERNLVKRAVARFRR